MNDSTGQTDSDIYNAAHWDGNEWELKRIKVNFRGNEIIPPLEGIQAFSGSDIWVAGSLPIHGDGESWNIYDVRTTVDESLSLWEIWGAGTDDVYAGGTNGSLAHWNGENWQKIETNTELDFYDIHGNSEQGVVAVAAKIFENFDKVILKINPSGKVQPLSVEGIPYPISGVWFNEYGVAYIVGSGMYRKPDISSSVVWQAFHQGITNNYLQAIDGSGLNDIVAAGAFGELLHFNGAKWTSFQQLFDGNLLGDVAIRKDVIVAVGFEGRRAFITIGKRE